MSAKKKTTKQEREGKKRVKKIRPDGDESRWETPEARRVFRRFPAIRKRLLVWFEKNQREYPWRRTSNWFHLLMAEMMLRRTRSDQVLRVYNDFTSRFPSVHDASRMKKKDLEEMLKPLGLAWRASQTFDTIEYIRDTYDKRSPSEGDDFLHIPGVGPYSSAMLRNRLFGIPVAAIDSNVARILLRFFNFPYHAESRRDIHLMSVADRFVKTNKKEDSKKLNLAMIDFSALVCKPIRPACCDCPLRPLCESGLRNCSGNRP